MLIAIIDLKNGEVDEHRETALECYNLEITKVPSYR